MRFPSINNYIEAVMNLHSRLLTLSDIRTVFDKEGYPLFYSSKGVVTFMVECSGKVAALKCFTSVKGYERTSCLAAAGIIHGSVVESELLVFDDHQSGDYYPIFLEFDNERVADEAAIYNEGLIPFESGGLWGYKEKETGEVVIEAMYDRVEEFEEGRAVVVRKGLSGLSKPDGKLVINTIFDEISWDGSAIAYCNKKGKWGCFDRSGREIVGCRYDWMGEFSDGLLLVRSGGKYGYVDLQGVEAITPAYENATSFDESGFARVRLAGKDLVINTKGEVQ
ncbi:hypothetical protein BN938_0260 [Mucinivorans hirudinis]|uniref:WG repeat-containing protein n=1 Tax=Mucinivorans hirudinis TaxID=1433126 RepID=A0A060R608_9BACT|nr:hypothetical protein BN938_0260 [Mucinivorans hirudinis]